MEYVLTHVTVDVRHKDSSNLNETLVHKPESSMEVIGSKVRERSVSESHAVTTSEDAVGPVDSLPPTLTYLVLFWQELTKCTLKKVTTEHGVVAGSGLKKREDSGRVVAKKTKDVRRQADEAAGPAAAAAVRGNLFGTAAVVDEDEPVGSGDRDCEVLCELCGSEFAHPVTYHMRKAHPGCGRPAGGHGYNSGGSFCGGWAGSCGDGGVGGSTWYLMCEACRTKYLREKKRSSAGGSGGTRRKDRLKKPVVTRKRTIPVSTVRPSQPHWVVYSNAMFVLDLAGDGDSASVSQTSLTSVSEDGSASQLSATFPLVPFLYLQLHRVQSEDDDDARCSGGSDGLDRSVTHQHRPAAYHADVDPDGKSLFQRSISEMGNIVDGDGSGGGVSLVKRPSVNMLRLIRSLDAVDSVTDHIASSPLMTFMTQLHELELLRRVMVQAVRRATCRTYALHALNWLIRRVSQTSCLHDLLGHFVAVLTLSASDLTADLVDADQDVAVCAHPLADVSVAGDVITRPLAAALHTFLQSVSDVLMYVPPGSAVQRMAVRCWSMPFQTADHTFLHRSHVFSHISSILSTADEATTSAEPRAGGASIEHLTDVTLQADIKSSSRQAMVSGMTDGSTETFWESGDDDKNKTKTLMINYTASDRLRVVCVHVDNTRDLGSKVSSVVISAGLTVDCLEQLRHAELDQRHVGWVCAWLANSSARCVHLELRGPDNTLRIRQLKLLAESSDGAPATRNPAGDGGSGVGGVEQRLCETETLTVFRLLTSLVFGRLVGDSEGDTTSSPSTSSRDDADLKQHMVGILFSHTTELTKLQRQVCAHIVSSLRLEAGRVKTLWQHQQSSPVHDVGDDYCFELLSLLLALSGSSVGRRYVAQQNSLIEDLVSLLHTASPRVQRQVVSLLHRTLPDIAPASLAAVLDISTVPLTDLSAVLRVPPTDSHRRGLLDVFLACIAKALSVQLKSRQPAAGVSRCASPVSLCSCRLSDSGDSWWLRGSVSSQLAESIVQLLGEMAAGRLGADWAGVTKCAVADPILSLSRLPVSYRTLDMCLQSSVTWLALAALCVVTSDHVTHLSTGRWAHVASPSAVRNPTCDNHDDGETPATLLCTSGCGSLCGECDRVLHLRRTRRHHQRQVTLPAALCIPRYQ